jgi:hypothetical protein
MKHLSIIFLGILSMVTYGCGNKSSEGNYGAQVDTTVYLSPDEVFNGLDSAISVDCTVKGTVTEVCQAEGCWLKLKKSDGSGLLVRAKGHSFTVPKDIADHTVYVTGIARFDTTDVETLKDYAKDAGKSQAEIDSITSPEITPLIEAEGVLVR